MAEHHRGPATRREFLGRACQCGAGLAALTLLPACATEGEAVGPTVDLSELPDGARVILMDDSLPIEVSRVG